MLRSTMCDSIVVSIPRCHRGVRGSIPRRAAFCLFFRRASSLQRLPPQKELSCASNGAGRRRKWTSKREGVGWCAETGNFFADRENFHEPPISTTFSVVIDRKARSNAAMSSPPPRRVTHSLLAAAASCVGSSPRTPRPSPDDGRAARADRPRGRARARASRPPPSPRRSPRARASSLRRGRRAIRATPGRIPRSRGASPRPSRRVRGDRRGVLGRARGRRGGPLRPRRDPPRRVRARGDEDAPRGARRHRGDSCAW